mgnify:CR=1 FL=1
MSTLTYTVGDATDPTIPDDGTVGLILHVTNAQGGWGAGFVLALSRRWPMRLKERSPEYVYRFGAPDGITLGTCKFVQVEPNLVVVNMCAQNGFRSAENPVPLDYKALIQCILRVQEYIRDVYSRTGVACKVTGPKFGSDLAGGDWSLIEKILDRVLVSNVCVDVEIYTLT